MENKSKELEVAIKAALEAGKVLEKYFETEILKEFKEDKSIVTLADGESEKIIKKIIVENFPDNCILGEETGFTKNTCNDTWHIDPVDGTKNFANGIPLFAISIALERDGDIIVGVVYNPATKSLFYAEKGKGAYLNDRRISVSKDDSNIAIISGGKGRKAEDRKLCRELLCNLPEKFQGLTVRDIGSAALDLAYLSRGGLEVTVQLGLNSYDVAAGLLLVLESGGMITTIDGNPWKLSDNNFLVSNGVFHDSLISEIKNQKEKLSIV